jgi:hippurate hydrolase
MSATVNELPPTVLPELLEQADAMRHVRRDIHAHPELCFEEVRTADLVARTLHNWGIEVHTGLGKTGVVGVIRGRPGRRAIGLRADMDALPIQELNTFAHASRNAGKMHACGHDGHTAMLLGAARYLAETRAFNGTVNFIFQPGEEGVGGALAMLKDGLFERFPCNAIYAIHNRPGLEVGKYAICPGPSAAGGAFFDIEVTGRGAHGARPEASVDPVLAACHITTALQSIVARNVPPSDTAVLSVTRVVGGDAYNVIPQTATISGTARAFRPETMKLIEEGMKRVAEGVAAGFGAAASLDFRVIFAPLINQKVQTDAIADTAAELVGEAAVDRAKPPGMGSEDFSFMMEQVPGAYIQIGNGKESGQLHNPHYDFNDAATPYGAALFARLVERELPRGVRG